MGNVFIISSNRLYAEALKRFLELKKSKRVYILEIPEILDTFTFPLLEIFKSISASFENFKPADLLNSIAILDLPFYDSEIEQYQPLRNPPGINQLASLLIFAFPEIHWVLPLYYGKNGQNNSHFVKWSDLPDIFPKIEGHTPLFDSSNLRNEILKATRETYKEEARYLSVREDDLISASIDEEEAYAYLHGYLAYKLGYRNYVVTTLSEMKSLNQSSDNSQVKLIFEDIYLNFPDEHPKDFSNLQYKRDNEYKFLPSSEKRIFVTVGHKGKFDLENREYIKFLKSLGKKIKKVFKPSGGIYNLLEKSGLLKNYWEKRKQEWKLSKVKEMEEEGGGHSAPGRLLLIAENLIDRAEKILKKAITVEECIQGATLAFEAQRLLGNRTPTTSLEAIALKHQLEVKAECMFYGISYNIDVKNRIKEIEKEIETVGHWFNKKVKRKAILNAKMSIITEIMNIFREYGQFDEEQECLNYFRKWNRAWSLHQPGFKGFLSWMVFPIRWYIETLLESFPLFVTALLFWPSIFHFIIFTTNAKYEGRTLSIAESFTNSLSTFFGLQPTKFPESGWAYFITISLILLGFLHLGIFISFLFSLITKGRR